MNVTTKYISLLDIIDQINILLETEHYIAALTLALTIPDKCGKIAYPEMKSGKERYIKWYDNWCWCYTCSHINNPSASEVEFPDIGGKFIYQLRCAMLHENTTKLDYAKVEEKNRTDDFQLEISDSIEDYVVVYSWVLIDGKRLLAIRLIDLCKLICYAAKEYYEGNKEKVDSSNNIQIIDARTLKQ